MDLTSATTNGLENRSSSSNSPRDLVSLEFFYVHIRKIKTNWSSMFNGITAVIQRRVFQLFHVREQLTETQL